MALRMAVRTPLERAPRTATPAKEEEIAAIMMSKLVNEFNCWTQRCRLFVDPTIQMA